MTSTIARIRHEGKHFEVKVDLDEALKFKKGEIDSIEAEVDKIFTDIKKGNVASTDDLEKAFGTSDVNEVVKKIVRRGEVQTTQDYRDEEKDKKLKQVIDFLATNSVDPKTGNPHSIERIKNAIRDSGVNIKNVPIENQIKEIVDKINKVIPIKIETKKVKITVPAVHTGRAYGIVNQYKETEKWKDDGSLEVIVSVPAGIVIDFYEKLNNVTHGSALTQELGEE